MVGKRQKFGNRIAHGLAREIAAIDTIARARGRGVRGGRGRGESTTKRWWVVHDGGEVQVDEEGHWGRSRQTVGAVVVYIAACSNITA